MLIVAIRVEIRFFFRCAWLSSITNRLHKIKETKLVHGKKSIGTKIKTESGHLRAVLVGENFDITQSEAS